MQNRGVFILFSVVLTLVCMYELSFTWVARNIEQNAKNFAAGDEVKERRYLDSMAGEPVYDILVKEFTYRECKENELNLGLDLRGGMNVTLELSVESLIRTLANNSEDSVFVAAVNKARYMQRESQDHFVNLFGIAFSEIDPNAKLASPSIFGTREMQGRINYNTTNEEVLTIIRAEADDAIDRTFDILRTRIDKFGVTQPSIQRYGNSGRIAIELPGVKEPARVRKLLQGTAALEFWETYGYQELIGTLSKINEKLRQSAKVETQDTTRRAIGDTSSIDNSDEPVDINEKATGELSLLEGLASDDTIGGLDSLSDGSDFGLNNPLFDVLRQAQGRPNDARIGLAEIKDTSKVNEYFNRSEIRALLPRDLRLLWGVKPTVEGTGLLDLFAIKVRSRDKKAPLGGEVVVDANQSYSQVGKPEVDMTMNAEGAKVWKRLTGENVDRCIAIVLDGYVYSAPNVESEIAGGRSNIMGNFTINEAKDLANVLKAGKLPANARIVEEAVVGPSLGKEAIAAGLNSFLIALLLVMVYMVFYYNRAGIVSNLALFANIFFILGVLASLKATLTLPGIAGIVLTIGMSVDANVLIYERIREELRQGKGLKLAIADGYKNAYSAIVDANVTTFITGIALYAFGSGPIKGFATTLLIGIITSLFSAIFITRIIFSFSLDRKKIISFATGLTKNAFTNLNFPFIHRRKLFYISSLVIIAMGIVSFATKGLNFGVDFKGGRTYIVRFDKSIKSSEVAKVLAVPLHDPPEVKTYGSGNQVKVTTDYLIDDDDEGAESRVEQKLKEGLGELEGYSYEIMSSQKVGPTIADDIKTSALWAVIFSLLGIFFYILVRFRKWQFGLGALSALFHDVLIVLSCFSIFYGVLPFSLEIDQAFIAAILTVIGYSINDTVVVFDRIREYLELHKKRPVAETFNSALNSTLSRTFNTSITIAFVLVAILLLGSEVIQGLSFGLLIGVIVGTYSSLCIASPIALDLLGKKNNSKNNK